MRAAKVLAVLAIAALGIGSFSAVALAAKKKKTAVIFFNQSPKIGKSGKVNAKGSLNTVSACEPKPVDEASGTGYKRRGPHDAGRLYVRCERELDTVRPAQLPKTLPAGTNSVRVKAKKRTVGKFVCQAGVSPNVAIPAV